MAETILSGREATRRIIEGMQLLPFVQLAHLAGKSARSFLSEVTGLSPARISQGNLDKLRPSTVRDVEDAASKWGRSLARNNGWTDDDFETYVTGIPRMRNGSVGLWANWIHGLQHPEALRLPLAIGHAMKMDELIYALSVAFDANDCTTFIQAVIDIESTDSEKVMLWSADDCAEVESERGAWRAASDWDAVATLLPQFAENLLFDIYAALDAEWGSRYLHGLAPMPVFLWLAPRVHEKWNVASGTIPSKNFIHRPVRRLLELSHALVHGHYRKSWPDAPAGRGELGRALELADAHIGNYFDGTRKLTIRAYQTHWLALCMHFGPAKNTPADSPICPIALGAVAIAWQRMLITITDAYKFKSALLLDEDNYKRRWQNHRRCWAYQLPSGEACWPDWLLNQSVWSDSMRSSQSSGRSSSPRECQYSS